MFWDTCPKYVRFHFFHFSFVVLWWGAEDAFMRLLHIGPFFENRGTFIRDFSFESTFSFFISSQFLSFSIILMSLSLSLSLIYYITFLVSFHEDCFNPQLLKFGLFRHIWILIVWAFNLRTARSTIGRMIFGRIRVIGMIRFRTVIDLIFLFNKSILITPHLLIPRLLVPQLLANIVLCLDIFTW